MAKVNLLIACWYGLRQNEVPQILDLVPFPDLDHIHKQIGCLSYYRHNLAQITVISPAGEPKHFLRNVPGTLGGAKVEVLIRPNNCAHSYGSWDFGLNYYRDKFTHYILLEDDYCCVQHHFDEWMLDNYEEEYLMQYVCDEHHPKHPLYQPTGEIPQVALSPDKTVFATLGMPVRWWDSVSGKELGPQHLQGYELYEVFVPKKFITNGMVSSEVMERKGWRLPVECPMGDEMHYFCQFFKKKTFPPPYHASVFFGQHRVPGLVIVGEEGDEYMIVPSQMVDPLNFTVTVPAGLKRFKI
jgi:hypothetical protein